MVAMVEQEPEMAPEMEPLEAKLSKFVLEVRLNFE